MSLSPRFDLFRFVFSKDFLPEEVRKKYQIVLNHNAAVITTPIDYLNESIQGVHMPGMSQLTMEQQQHESNQIVRKGCRGDTLGRINTEPIHTLTYRSAGDPLEKIEREFKVTFRMNQGLYNYYMLYETIMYYYMKETEYPSTDVLYIEVLNDEGAITCRIKFKDVHIDGIDGLDFSYDKSTRENQTFNLTLKYNNIEFEFIPYEDING